MTLQLKNLFNLGERKAKRLRLLYEFYASQVGVRIHPIVRIGAAGFWKQMNAFIVMKRLHANANFFYDRTYPQLRPHSCNLSLDELLVLQ